MAQTVRVKYSDNWKRDLAEVVGYIGIAFAQLNREIYLAAKRKAGKKLADWKSEHKKDYFSDWCKRLRKDHPDDSALIALVDRAEKAATARHDVFHAV